MIRFIIVFFLILFSCNSNEKNKSISELAKTTPESNATKLPEITNRFITGKNYLFIKDITPSDNNTITFNLGWDASWRNGDEYDAAWIFIKKNVNKTSWKHANISPENARMVTNQSSDMADAELAISPNGVGMIIRRQQNGQGDNNWTISVQLQEAYDVSNTEFRVFGIEMVHIASGPYELGTLKGERDRREELTPGAGGAPYDPLFTYKSNAKNNYGGIFKINSEDPIDIGKTDGNLFWIDANIPGTNTFSGVPEGTLSSKFPKGFRAFYQMKYEMSQQEYCDFLNTLTPKQQAARDISKIREFDRPIADYRNAIVQNNGVFSTNRPHRSCNFISWLDGQAYADWAGLRHMTELEFEKSCRGPKKAIYREYVWGVNEIEERSNMRYSTTISENNKLAEKEMGQETTDGNVHASMFSYRNFIDVCTPQGNFYDPDCAGCRSFEGGDGGRGPVRKGIFGVTSEGNRVLAGATYYGAMEMGGNLQEPVVAVGHPSGRKFEGTQGDGTLTSEGFSTNPDWQPIDSDYAFGGRGGCWKFHENHARTSDRFKGLRKNPNRRASHIGFRGVITDWQ